MKPSAPIFTSIALILLQLYSCASPSSLSGPDNSTVGYKQKLIRHELPICTNNSAWLSDQFWIASTCVIALSLLRDDLYKIPKRRKFLFYDVEDPPPIASDKQVTPLKYMHDDCTIAVIMLKRFAPGRLPGKSSRTQTFSLDDASWQEIYWGLKSLYSECVSIITGLNMPGWLSVGGYILFILNFRY